MRSAFVWEKCERFDAGRLRPMFGQLALSSSANMRSGETSRHCGQRLGAARKAGSFEGTLPRPFSLRGAEAENWPYLPWAACNPNSQPNGFNATSVDAGVEENWEVLPSSTRAPLRKGRGRRATGSYLSATVGAAKCSATEASRVDRPVRARPLLLDPRAAASQTRRVGRDRKDRRRRPGGYRPRAGRAPP